MNEQERQVIASIFERLRQVEGHPRDPEAERYIAERVAVQPYATYALAQAVYAQEQALLKLNAELEETQALLERERAQPAQSSSFLGSLFGGGARSAPAQERPAAAGPSATYAQQGEPGRPGPWSAARAGAQPAAGGGFLQNAAMTAAGVAGGMVLGNLLMNTFGGKPGEAAAGQNTAAQPASHEQPADDGRYQEASYDDPNADDDGMDFGGDDGWA